MSDTSTLWLHHSIPKGDPHGRCTHSPHSPCLHGCMHGCMRPSVIDVFGAVTKPQLCSEHVGTCTCGGYINSKSTSDCIMYHDCVQEHVPVVSISTLNLCQIVFRVLCTHNWWRAFMQGGGNLFQCANKCGSHALKWSIQGRYIIGHVKSCA